MDIDLYNLLTIVSLLIATLSLLLSLKSEKRQKEQGDKANKLVQIGNNAAEQGNFIAREGNTIAIGGNKIASEGNTIAREGNDIAENGNTIARVGNTIAIAGNKIASEGNTIAREGNDIAENGNTIASTGNDIAKDDFSSDVHRQFAEMWFMMDETFIQYPELHKYFYKYNPNGKYQTKPAKEDYNLTELPKDELEFERAICIAEKFRDVFQYSEHMALKIVRDYPEDCASYLMYMQRIQNTAIYKKMLELNHVEIEDAKPIGSELGDILARQENPKTPGKTYLSKITKTVIEKNGAKIIKVYEWPKKDDQFQTSNKSKKQKNKQ